MDGPKRRWSTVLIAAVTAFVIAFPAAVWGSHQFSDVATSNVFHNAIAWMADNGITVGCNPPANNKYCPDDNVTRGQMAAFMKRLAENNVVDAATLDGLDSSELVSSSQVLFASVTDLGVLYGNGNAVSAKRISTGHYEVTFDRSTEGCAGTATAGFAENVSGLSNISTTFGVDLGTVANFDPNTAVVFIYRPDVAANYNSSFHLVIICATG
jgi:hypothetical protein